MKTTRKDYYAGGKRGSFDGVPIWRPKWWGTLGNDKEAREALKPRGIKQAYYEGGHRMTIDGIPVRVAAHVKGWKAKNKAALCQGFQAGRWDWANGGRFVNDAVIRDLFEADEAEMREAA